ncbi:hypothetical protein GH733_006644 [Mirounga leonina]|nr:hypothetical protein GH733_006644 [Mirounga leonina]
MNCGLGFAFAKFCGRKSYIYSECAEFRQYHLLIFFNSLWEIEKPYRRLCFSVPGEGTVVKMSALNWKPFVYGGLASITAECGTFPIDLTKTRLQIQGQTNDANFKEIRYRGMLHALVRIGREEGLKALYSGIAPAMLRQASYGTIKIGIYQSLKRLFVEHPEGEECPLRPRGLPSLSAWSYRSSFTCGLAGALASNPVDVVRTRMMNQRVLRDGRCSGHTGTLDCLLQNSLFWKVCPAQRSPELVRGDVIFEEALGAGVRGFRDISAVVVLFQADLGKANEKTF